MTRKAPVSNAVDGDEANLESLLAEQTGVSPVSDISREIAPPVSGESTPPKPDAAADFLESLQRNEAESKGMALAFVEQAARDLADGRADNAEEWDVESALREAGLTTGQFSEMVERRKAINSCQAQIAREPEYRQAREEATKARAEYRAELKRRQKELIDWEHSENRRVGRLEHEAQRGLDDCRKARAELLRLDPNNEDRRDLERRRREEATRLAEIGVELDAAKNTLQSTEWHLANYEAGKTNVPRNKLEERLPQERRRVDRLQIDFDRQQRVYDGLAARVAELTEAALLA